MAWAGKSKRVRRDVDSVTPLCVVIGNCAVPTDPGGRRQVWSGGDFIQ